MPPTELTSYLLDRSLVDYTVAAVRDALHSSSPNLQEQAKKRAAYATQFFLDILDPSIEEEGKQLQTFKLYNAALNDAVLAEKIKQELQLPLEQRTRRPNPEEIILTPAQRVLSLPDTLDLIFAHIPLLTKSDRHTFYHTALTSHALYNAAQLRLWRRPRDLDTVKQQVHFAFGTAISGATGDSLGLYVKRLRIRILKGGWNFRLVETIATLVPGVVDLTLHWGDTEDGQEHVTSGSVASLHKILSSLPNLRHLYLAQFAYTPEAGEVLNIPAGVHAPFAKLESLRIYGFRWYWETISRGLGQNLKSLDIGYGTTIDGDKIVEICAQIPSLTTLRVASGLEARHIRSIIGNLSQLERVEITSFTEVDDEYVVTAIALLAGLEHLKELSFSSAIGSSQLKVLINSSSQLENITLKLKVDNELADTLENLFKAKRRTLKSVSISFDEDVIAPSDKLVEALAGVPNLELISIDFQQPHQLSSSAIEKLLKQCPKLEWTSSLEELVAGNPLYEAEYKTRLERERDDDSGEAEEDLLGN